MTIKTKNEQLLSVVSEIADKESDALGKARIGSLVILGNMMGVSKQCISLWLRNGMPLSYRDRMRELMTEKNVHRTIDEFEAMFKKK